MDGAGFLELVEQVFCGAHAYVEARGHKVWCEHRHFFEFADDFVASCVGGTTDEGFLSFDPAFSFSFSFCLQRLFDLVGVLLVSG